MANEINIAEARARIKARAWRNLAQSELDVKGFDQNTLDDVISLVSDAALLELEELPDRWKRMRPPKTSPAAMRRCCGRAVLSYL